MQLSKAISRQRATSADCVRSQVSIRKNFGGQNDTGAHFYTSPSIFSSQYLSPMLDTLFVTCRSYQKDKETKAWERF